MRNDTWLGQGWGLRKWRETGKLAPALEVEPTRVLADWTEGMRGTWRGVGWLLSVCFANFGHGGEAEWEGRCVGHPAGMESCAGT